MTDHRQATYRRLSPAPPSPTPSAPFVRTPSRMRMVLLILAGTSAALVGVYRADIGSSGLGRLERCGADLYDQHGFIHMEKKAEGAEDIRWIPYTAENVYPSSLDAVADIYNTSVHPSDADLASSPPAYSTLLETDPQSPSLSFARNSTIVLVGDSHDRKNLESMCSRVPGAVRHAFDGHLKWGCSLPSIGLNFVLLFHYGLMTEDEPFRDVHDQPPNLIERRVDQILLPMLQDFTPSIPSLIVFQSGFWDLRYWGLRAQAEGANAQGRLAAGLVNGGDRPLLWSELKWYRRRFGEVLEALKATFPNSGIITRTIQPYRDNRNGRNVAIFEMNESIKAISRRHNIATMRWAELLQGTESYADDQHFEIGSLPYRLWMNMVLYQLERSLLGCLHGGDRL
ncbi:BZ3500_MvSof-1268-A1-R1_Chr1-3g01621 [Microbotryum saponariae]|uniref:BZ3500_MvSof-1268-A1-R1_Chr1-3g01621 protein n=1 Tax=Microbotryum saponariae TaxID=289078 RepID=A0A2X0KRF9_9BASI|nr:BZ3500_MvSof-1268-A1-R1_Chr1-3g01621 [Microbotryum saponariae]SCZ94166.1 BZ3501_MvSof-1269-A2-R1_Chr1-3g01222 [Microbotryum saponariae]